VTKRPTLADVAKRSGMSVTAVSLVLNDRPGSRLSEEAKTRIRTAAQELEYRPNPAARSLRLGKTRTIGFVSDDVTITRYGSAMIRGALTEADAHDYTVLMAETAGHPQRIERAIKAMLDRRPDGLISLSRCRTPRPASLL
jgi:LacI family transcriptional regulator